MQKETVNMKWQKLMAVAATVFMMAGTALAATASNKSTPMRGDADASGSLSKAEILEERDSFFMTIDADKDGKIKIQELIDYLAKDFDARDSNQDGVLVADEFVVYWCGKPAKSKTAKGKAARNSKLTSNMHKHMDKNKDGSINQNECVSFWSMRFGAADSNKDGKLTKEEFLQVMKQAVKRMDTNKNGIITVEEYRLYWTGNQPIKPAAKSVKSK